MATFAYVATNAQGKRQSGVVTADTGRQAREALRGQGLVVRTINQRVAKETQQKWSIGPQRRYRSRLTVVMRELATLLQAGIPLLSALDSIVEEARGGLRACLVSVRDRIAAGSSLAEAMESEPAVFDQMTVGMVRVGEHAGNLDEVCQQIAEFRERSGEMADRVLSAVLYPAIVLMVSIAVSIFLMTAVVPMLLTNLVEMGQPLPWPTHVLKVISDTLLEQGIWIAIGLVMVAVSVLAYLKSETGRLQFANLCLRVPVLGTLIQKQTLSRMSLIVSSLLRSGVELVDALAIAERSATHVLLKRALRELRVDLEAGRNLSDSMRRHRIFSHSLRQVFHLGQQSGKLEVMLQRIGVDYDKQAVTMSTRLASVLEPILIINLAVMVGFILFATVLPILEAGNVLAE